MKSSFVCAFFFSFMIHSAAEPDLSPTPYHFGKNHHPQTDSQYLHPTTTQTNQTPRLGNVLSQYEHVNNLAGQLNIKYEYFLEGKFVHGFMTVDRPPTVWIYGFYRPPTGVHVMKDKDCLDLSDGKLMCLFKAAAAAHLNNVILDQYITLNPDLAEKVKAGFASCGSVRVRAAPPPNNAKPSAIYEEDKPKTAMDSSPPTPTPPSGGSPTCASGLTPFLNTPSAGVCSCGTSWDAANRGGVRCRRAYESFVGISEPGKHVSVGISESNESKGFVFSQSLVFAYLLGALSTVFVYQFLSKRNTELTVTFLDDI